MAFYLVLLRTPFQNEIAMTIQFNKQVKTTFYDRLKQYYKKHN